MKIKVVLGMGWGDEGKGITTDYLCSQAQNPLVVRFSGGHQAGHTVMLDGKKHVFSSFGSGTLRGIPTMFTHETCIYPNVMNNEWNVLEDKGITPKLTVNPMAAVTTPYDVAWNRLNQKGNGTCGLGVGTTMSRMYNTGYKLYTMDLFHRAVARAKVDSIKDYYFALAKEIGKSNEFEHLVAESVPYFWKCVDDLKFNLREDGFEQKFDEIIFEGSQGILLDQDHGIFPHVTYARTTYANISSLLKHGNVDLYYVTRCYQTRHGDGWMSSDTPVELVNTEEEINVTNDYQGKFRTAEIDYNLLKYAMDCNDIYVRTAQVSRKHLVVTCLDQRPDFQFDYHALPPVFESIIESRSPYSKDFTIKY